MGIFSRKRTYVDTQTQPLFEVDDVDDPIKTAVVRSLVWGTGIFDEFMKEITHGFHTQVNAAYRYAKNGHYTYGTPDIEHFGQSRLKDAVLPVLEGIYGAGITFDFLIVGDLHPIFAGFDRLYNVYGFDPSDNTVAHYTSQTGFDTYLDDVVAHHEQAGPASLRSEDIVWTGPNPRGGVIPSRQYSNGIAELPSYPTYSSINGVEIFYEWIDDSGEEAVIETASELIDLSGFEDQEYIQAVVRKPDNSIHIWKYLPGTGTYPTLDALTEIVFTSTGDYFPFIPFRAAKTDLTVDKETDEYKSTVKLMKRMNMDYQDISDQIHSNPDIADIEQAIITLAVPGDTANQTDLEYLFKFFEKMSDNQIVPEHTQELTGGGYMNMTGSSNVIRWYDAGFELRLSFYDLKKQTRAGLVTDVGKYKLIKGTETVTLKAKNRRYNTELPALGPEYYEETFDYEAYSYCYQVNPQIFIEVRLVGAIAEYPVDGKYSTFFFSDTNQFVVPVDMEVIKTMRWKVKNEFYLRNLRFIFNSKITEKLKWYESGLFKAFMTIVAFVALVFGLFEITKILLDITAATSVAAALAAAQPLVTKFIILKLLGIAAVKILGPEYALIASMVVLASGLSGGIDFPTVGLLTSESLIGMVSSIQEAIKSELGKAFAKYNEEYRSFLEESEAKLQEIENLKEEMGLNLLDSPYKDKYMVPMYIPGESPDNFFNRTIHTGNVGTVAYKSIENFVSNSIKLPGIDNDLSVGVQIYV